MESGCHAAARGVDDGTQERVEQATSLLTELVPCAAFALAAWDPSGDTHRHRVLASRGYTDGVLDHLNDAYVRENPAFQLLYHRVPRALRWQDLARDWGIDFAATFSAEEYLRPAGFNEGTTACLRLPEGRYAGALHVSWNTPSAATDANRDMIERLRPIMSVAADLLRSARNLADTLVPEDFVIVIAANGVATEISGRPPGPHLGEHGQLRALLEHTSTQTITRQFLWFDQTGGLHRVEFIPCRGGDVLVAERSTAPPYGLTPRELEVMSRVAVGESNLRIAERLFVSPRTVSTHIEHMLAKARCTSRAQLAALAVREGILLSALR
jgi:DNA-binding CsgD family transcriptional regulator